MWYIHCTTAESAEWNVLNTRPWTAPGCVIRWSSLQRLVQSESQRTLSRHDICEAIWTVQYLIYFMTSIFSLAPKARSMYHVRHVAAWSLFSHNNVAKTSRPTANLFHLPGMRLASELIGLITSGHPCALILADISLWRIPGWLSYQHLLWANTLYQTQE